MLVTNCPRCGEPFRVPAQSIPGDADATCPWCNESFLMAEIEEGLPPLLIVAPQWLADDQPSGDQPAAVDPAIDGPPTGEPFGGDETRPTEAAPAEAPPTAAPPVAAPSTSAPSTSAPDARSPMFEIIEDPAPEYEHGEAFNLQERSLNSRKPQRSWMSHWLVQAVIGLLIAIPLALLTLTLIGSPPDLGFWPFDNGAPKRQAASARSTSASPGSSASQRPDDANKSLASDLPANGTSTDPPDDRSDPGSNANVRDSKTDNAAIEEIEPSAHSSVDQAVDRLLSLGNNGPPPERGSESWGPYWREVAMTYSAVAAAIVDESTTDDGRKRLLTELEMSDRLDDLMTRTPTWLRPGPSTRQSKAILNDGVILRGRFNGGREATVTLADGTEVAVTGYLPDTGIDQPILALGIIEQEDDQAAKTVRVVDRRMR